MKKSVFFGILIAMLIPCSVYADSLKIQGAAPVKVGHTRTLTVTTSKKVTWKSSNKKVLTVSSKGKIKGIKTGTAKITATVGKKKVTKKITVFKLKKNSTTWVAHRGYAKDYKENTLGAFYAAGEKGFAACECDVRETKEDENGETELILNHDSSFSKVWGVDKDVSDLTYQEILDDPRLEEVCTYEDYLQCCRECGMIPYVELKSVRNVEKVVNLLKEFNESCILTYDMNVLEEAREYREGYPIDLKLIISKSSLTQDGYDNIGMYDGVVLYYKRLNSEISDFCYQNGITVNLWTIKNTVSYDELLYNCLVKYKYVVDSMTCDDKCW